MLADDLDAKLKYLLPNEVWVVAWVNGNNSHRWRDEAEYVVLKAGPNASHSELFRLDIMPKMTPEQIAARLLLLA
jgi:hypothetical protein